jgi:hypothetical protein
MFACINIGVLVGMAWQYFQNSLPLSIAVVTGLIALVLLNGFTLFMYKKATRQKDSK